MKQGSNNIELVKELRKITGRSIMECRKATEEVGSDLEKAKKALEKLGQKVAAEKAKRETKQGFIASYIHANGKIGVLVEIFCETDFVAKNEEFRNWGKEIAMQIAAMTPKDEKELLKQEYIRDSSKTIKKFLGEAIAKFGENIKLGKFIRLEI